MTDDQSRLRPRDGALYVVRWLRSDGRNVRHRYFRRRHDAQAYAARLRGFGKSPRVYRSATAWTETTD